jgi:hypothetical protein
MVVSTSLGQADPCVQAQNYYQNLDVDKAVATAAAALALSDQPLVLCLEVQALSHIVMGQLERGRALLRRLFTFDQDYVIDDPSLSPSMQDVINSTRMESTNLSQKIATRWLSHDALAVNIRFSEGSRPSHRVRYSTRIPTTGDTQRGEMGVVDGVSTATISVLGPQAVSLLEISGVVRTKKAAVIHEFTQTLQLGPRPAPIKRLAAATVEPQASWLKSWWFWTGLGIVAVGSGLGSYLLIDGRNPECPGGLGCLEIGN